MIDDSISKQIEELIRKQIEDREKSLVEIIANYDFIVGSEELKKDLMSVLPEGTNIVYSPYYTSPTSILAIKKFDLLDLIKVTNKE